MNCSGLAGSINFCTVACTYKECQTQCSLSRLKLPIWEFQPRPTASIVGCVPPQPVEKIMLNQASSRLFAVRIFGLEKGFVTASWKRQDGNFRIDSDRRYAGMRSRYALNAWLGLENPPKKGGDKAFNGRTATLDGCPKSSPLVRFLCFGSITLVHLGGGNRCQSDFCWPALFMKPEIDNPSTTAGLYRFGYVVSNGLAAPAADGVFARATKR